MNVLRNASPLILANLVVSGSSFIVLPLIAHYVGRDEFSTYAALVSLQAAFLTMVLATFATGSVKVILDNNEPEVWKSCILTERAFLTAAAVLFPFICFVVWSLISSEPYNLSWALACAFGMVFRGDGAIAAICRSNGKLLMFSGVLIAFSILKLIFTVLATFLLQDIFFILLVASLCDSLLALVLQRNLKLDLIFKFVTRKTYHSELVSRGRTLSLGNISDSLVSNLDRLIVGYALGPGDIGFYHIMRKFIGLLGMLTTPINQYLLPVFTSKIDLINRKLIEASTVLLGVFSIGAVLAILSYDYYSHYLFMDSELIKYEFFSLLILQMLATSFCAVHPAVVAFGYLKYSTWVTVASNVVFVFVALVLAPELGLTGMILAIGVQYFMSISLKIHLLLRVK